MSLKKLLLTRKLILARSRAARLNGCGEGVRPKSPVELDWLEAVRSSPVGGATE